MMNAKYPLCQIGGCHRRAGRAVEIDLPAAWEASATFTTLSVVAGLCDCHGHEAARRVQAMLQGRVEHFDLLSIITAAVPYEREQREKLERAEAEVERLELELGGARQQLRDTEAELRHARRDGRHLVAAGGGV